MKASTGVRTLSEALIQIEEFIEKMGGEMGPEMEVCQSAIPGCIWVKSTLFFDLEKLNGYTAQCRQQGKGTD
jgi:hypothetical protein